MDTEKQQQRGGGQPAVLLYSCSGYLYATWTPGLLQCGHCLAFVGAQWAVPYRLTVLPDRRQGTTDARSRP